MLIPFSMVETDLSPIHSLPTGLCEDPSGEASNLIGRMAMDDPAALAELHAMWSPALLGIACQILGHEREAETVVEDTFVHLWQRAAEYNPHQVPPMVWAFAVMRTYCMDRLRRRRRRQKDSSLPLLLHAPPDKTENPQVMPVEDFRRVRAALEHLAPDERSCLELAVFLKFRDADSADNPDSPPGTIKNRLRQALKKVRNHLSRYEL